MVALGCCSWRARAGLNCMHSLQGGNCGVISRCHFSQFSAASDTNMIVSRRSRMPNNKKKKGGNKKAAARSNAANKEDLAGLDDILRCGLFVPLYLTQRPMNSALSVVRSSNYCTCVPVVMMVRTGGPETLPSNTTAKLQRRLTPNSTVRGTSDYCTIRCRCV